MWPITWQKDKLGPMDAVDKERIPRHIAIIMDGNGRWAKRRGLPRSMGHKAGVEAIRDIVKACSNLGVEYLTVYAFSTENWSRPKDEVGILMRLLTDYLRRELEELHANNVKILALGDISQLPSEAQQELKSSMAKTRNNSGLVLNLALNYGGRSDIKQALGKLCEAVQRGELLPQDISEEMISQALFTAHTPDPDLMIRTSGEMRLSNFLLWQMAYTEIVVIECLWPDFTPKELTEAIIEYQKRDRRYGGLNIK